MPPSQPFCRVVERSRRPTTRYQWTPVEILPRSTSEEYPVVCDTGQDRADRRTEDPDPEVVERARDEGRPEPPCGVERGAGDGSDREHADGDREADRQTGEDAERTALVDRHAVDDEDEEERGHDLGHQRVARADAVAAHRRH